MTDARPVWLTREQRDEIDSQGFEPEVVALWDAAIGNRWAAFTDDELYAIGRSITSYDDAYGVGADGQRVQSEIESELERRQA